MKETIEAFEELFAVKSPKELAAETGTNYWVLNKWTLTGGSHRKNPVEYVVALTSATKHWALVDCICHKLGGFFVPDPPLKNSMPMNLAQAGNAVALRMAEFTVDMARAVGSTNILPEDVSLIRRRWELLKSAGEAFVRLLYKERSSRRE